MKLKTKFQDENFELGEVVEADVYNGGGRIKVIAQSTKGRMITFYFKTLKGLNEMFEDYEEPKEKHHWFISGRGTIEYEKDADDEFNRGHKSLGNYFETKEEAEKAVERLRAWKRLKDKGFEIESWSNDIGDNYYKTGQIVLNLNNVRNRDWCECTQIKEIKNDLDLLFGGEE